MDSNLPEVPESMSGISERLEEFNQKVQEQAFLLGYRNGYREGDMVQGLLAWIRNQQAEPDISQDRLDALRDAEHFMASNGAFISDGDEVTHPPGLITYLDAQRFHPFVQVAGERIEIQDLEFQWEPAPDVPEGRYPGFEPAKEKGEISVSITVNLPEDSTERNALMEYLDGGR